MKRFSAILLIVVALDQATKLLAVALLRDAQRSITLIENFLSFTYAENRGVAFGMEFAPPPVLLLLTGLITVGVVAFVARSSNRSPLFLLSFALVAGGGIGNLIDRARIGYVIDFIYFDLWHGTLFGAPFSLWPIFNVADSAITIGAGMLLFLYDRIFSKGGADVR